MSGLSRLCLLLCAASVPVAFGPDARAQSVLDLDTLTVLATKTEERAIDAMAGVSIVSNDVLDALQPTNLQQAFAGVPGLWLNTRSDDPGIGFNIRGLQDFGRVAVIVDGARQNFQVAQHGPQGKVYLDPDLISEADVARGPVSNIYGSGAIGGVVSIRTRDADDILSAGEKAGALVHGLLGTNQGPLLGSAFFAARPNDALDVVFGGLIRNLSDYADANGDKIENTGSQTRAGLLKATLRPAEGQEIKLGAIVQHSEFDSGDPGDPLVLNDGGTDYGNTVDTTTLTGKYRFESPDNPLVNFEATTYWSHTVQETVVKEAYQACAFGGPLPCGNLMPSPPFPPGTVNQLMDFTGPVGTTSGFNLTTYGADARNTSRFTGLGLDHTFTIGADYFQDDMVSTGSSPEPDAGFRMTGSGTRTAYGAFAQWMIERGSWLDVIAGLRYDGFNLDSTTHETEGSRLSPKITVGLTPLDGFTIYGTYAEGYRAPTVVEAFAAGEHPGRIFLFLPNPDLRPEIGRTLEAGVNLRYDGIFSPADELRVKANVFRNDLTDYIGLQDVSGTPECSFPDGAFGAFGDSCFQYRNTPNARIQGVELEASYDAGAWFAFLSGSLNDGKDLDTGEALIDVLRGRAYASVGARFFDRRLTIAPNWQYASGGSYTDSEGDLHVFHPYSLFGLTLGWQATEDLLATVVVENLFNVEYTPYLENNPSPGLSLKASLKMRIGG